MKRYTKIWKALSNLMLIAAVIVFIVGALNSFNVDLLLSSSIISMLSLVLQNKYEISKLQKKNKYEKRTYIHTKPTRKQNFRVIK